MTGRVGPTGRAGPSGWKGTDMKRSATFTSTDGARTSQGIATTERTGHLGHVVYVSRGVTFTRDDLESGTLGVLVDRYGDPAEGAPEMLAAARAEGWQATLIALKR